jgi:UDP-glucose 4-epimerase
MQDFVDTNVSGTLALLQGAVRAKVRAFVFTSTTSAFGAALNPPPGQPSAWITEAVQPVPKNIYGTTKSAAESLCELFHRQHGLACLVLRTSRFFPEADDDTAVRDGFADANVKVNELLYRRVDIEDVVSAHLRAAEQAPALGFGRYIISATTPFRPADVSRLNGRAREVVRERVPEFEACYERLGWRMFDHIDRVYDNAAARRDLGWQPRYGFASVLRSVAGGGPVCSPLADAVGAKGYHDERFSGTYPLLRPRL